MFWLILNILVFIMLTYLFIRTMIILFQAIKTAKKGDFYEP